jgi:hypothetical protein
MLQALGPLPLPTTDGPWPCRAGTVEKRTIRFAMPYTRQEVKGWTHKLGRWESLASVPGGGRAILAVLRGLLDFMDWRTGRLDPSWAAIARKALYSRSTVHTALTWLRAAGVIDWIPCCRRETGRDGRFQLRQETNVYIVRPPSQWRGFRDPTPPAPPPEPDTWGATPPLPSPLEAFTAAQSEGADPAQSLALLEMDPTDKLARALARLGRSITGPPK